MTEQPEEPRKRKPDLWSGLFGPVPTGPNPFSTPPKPVYGMRERGDLAGAGLSDAQLAALGVPPKAGERPPVELSAERRAHVARFSEEFKEWLAGGMTRGEALGLIAMEIQLEARYKHQNPGG